MSTATEQRRLRDVEADLRLVRERLARLNAERERGLFLENERAALAVAEHNLLKEKLELGG